MTDTTRTEFRTPLGPRLLTLLVVLILGIVSAIMVGFAILALVSKLWVFGLLAFAPCAGLLIALTDYVARDMRGKWGLRVALDADRLVLDLPAGRSLIHHPPAQHLTIPYADIEAVETRLEAYRTVGMGLMQRAYALHRKGAELIFLFEDRALGTPYESTMFGKLAADIASRAGVPVRNLGMVEGKGGVLAVWGTHAPDWAAPSLSAARQRKLWRAARVTGTLSLAIVIVAVVLRLLTLAGTGH